MKKFIFLPLLCIICIFSVNKLKAQGVPNDAAVNNVYTMGTIAIPNINPHVVTALIINAGTTAMSNLPVTLTVSGANSFTNTQTISNLAVGDSVIVTFDGYTSTNTGTNTVNVSIPSDGNNANNSISVTQTVNNNSYNYAYGPVAAGGAGFNGAEGQIAVKFTTNTPISIDAVNISFNVANQSFQVGIWDASGAGNSPGSVIYTSPSQNSVMGANTVTINPGINVSGTFYVGILQKSTTNMGLNYQVESPLRSNTFYASSPIGGSWTDFANIVDFRIMLEPVFSPAQAVDDAAVSNIYTMGTIAIPFANPHEVSARITNTGTTPINNLPVTLDVTGANTFSDTQTIASLDPGNSAIVTFDSYSSTNTGVNEITVTVPDDANNNNNSLMVNQIVTNDSYNYAYGTNSDGGAGFNGAQGEIAVKFNTSLATTINEVKTFFDVANEPYLLKIWDDGGPGGTPGTVLYTSSSQISGVGANTVSVTPPLNVDGTFYVGVAQTTTTNVSLSFQNEIPLRSQTFYAATPIGGNWIDLAGAVDFKVMIEPVFQPCSPPGQPTEITGNTSMCEGSTATYSISTIAEATSYTWNLPSGWTGTSTTNTISATAGSSGGNITVTANNSCGSSDTLSFAVTVNSLPAQPSAISGDIDVCEGVAVTYTVDTVAGATSYIWDLPSGWSGTSSNDNITVTTGSNSGSIQVSASNSCGAGPSQSLSVNINSPAVNLNNFENVCIDAEPFNLTGGSPSGGTYSGSGVSDGVFSPALAGIGTHTLTYSYNDGNCTGNATQNIIVEQCTHIEEKSIANSLTIMPNPVNDRLNIQFYNEYTSNSIIKIYSAEGRLIFSENVLPMAAYEKVIEVSGFAKGLYFIQVLSEEGAVNKKVVVH
ncbi:MAG: T9SS C-terminal target domain-containing protein [Chitinophagaceae bacterium]|nr:MAG: T9SS C-terminal target domain-containing protein [Chitinophagaceae bacterium]